MLSDRDYMRPHSSRFVANDGSVLKPLIWLNVIIFVLCNLSELGAHFQNLLVLHPWYIRQGQIWRMGSYMFAHGGLGHIFFNMWGLFFFGRLVERALGPQRFLNLYIASGVLGGLAWMAANWSGSFYAHCLLNGGHITRVLGPVRVSELGGLLRESDLVVSSVTGGVVGASGAVFGVMIAAAMTFPNVQVALLFPPVVMRLKTMMLCYMGIEVWQSFNQGSNIAHLAHLGGALGGFLYIKRLSQYNNRSYWTSLKQGWNKIRQKWKRRQFTILKGGAGRPQDHDYNPSAAEIDQVLDKLSKEGYAALNEQERQILRIASENLKRRSGR
jgi:membrane associated rhomboid family serine protease